MSEILQVEIAKGKLERFREMLNRINERKSVNLFDAVGMKTQEIKHSAFFAWLLDCSKPHKLGSCFLEKFLRDLLDFQSGEGCPQSNSEILLKAGIRSVADFSELLCDKHIKVQTERTLCEGEDGRIDIFLESQQAKTLVVIENKVFTTTHDSQLKRYEEEFSDREDWRKIFIYLTPNGDAPFDYDIDGNFTPRENWCVFSYSGILKICKELLQELPHTKDNARLKILLEDYIEMVDLNILGKSPEIKRLCKQILREHGEAFEILKAYTDNAEEAIAFCQKHLLANLAGFKPYREGKASFQFYTQSAEQYFLANSERLFTETKRLKFRYSVTSAKGAIEANVSLEKEREKPWGMVQTKILNAAAPNKATGELYCTLFSMELLSEEDREKDFESVRSALELRLNGFIHSIEAFEAKYLR